jgi:FKBP-type peptidyl-prolyl cis-trans isomerase 2
MIPLKVFHEKQVNPVAGMMFDFDGRAAKILTVSGGRVTVDFNNPLAGKTVTYNLEVLRKVEDLKEQVNAFNEFLFKKEFPIEIKEKKLIIEADGQFAQMMPMFKEKYKEIFDLDLEVKVEEPKKTPEKK